MKTIFTAAEKDALLVALLEDSVTARTAGRGLKRPGARATLARLARKGYLRALRASGVAGAWVLTRKGKGAAWVLARREKYGRDPVQGWVIRDNDDGRYLSDIETSWGEHTLSWAEQQRGAWLFASQQAAQNASWKHGVSNYVSIVPVIIEQHGGWGPRSPRSSERDPVRRRLIHRKRRVRKALARKRVRL